MSEDEIILTKFLIVNVGTQKQHIVATQKDISAFCGAFIGAPFANPIGYSYHSGPESVLILCRNCLRIAKARGDVQITQRNIDTTFATVLQNLTQHDVYVVIEYHHQRGYGTLYLPQHLLSELSTGPVGQQDLQRPSTLDWLRTRKGILGWITIEELPSYLVLAETPSNDERELCGRKRTLRELTELRIKANEAWQKYQAQNQPKVEI